ncbi:hypothetical protein [Ereboglobus luteus]|nr:hypothetical protein [Ereboglobus luteus]
MPNCDFYATAADHAPLLEWLLAENTCSIYELSSIGENPLRRFTSAAEIMDEFKRTYTNGVPWHSVYLQLHVNGSGPMPKPRRIDINPDAQARCGFRYRYAMEGWSLVQLYLSVPRHNKRFLDNSHTNHNSQKRAETWAAVSNNLGNPSAWDYKKITSFSSRLNREIRKRAVAKLGSRPVLPGALAEWKNGGTLGVYNIATHAKSLAQS